MSDFGKAVEEVIKRRQPTQFRAIAATGGSRFIKAKIMGSAGVVRVRVPTSMSITKGDELLITEYEKNKFSIMTIL